MSAAGIHNSGVALIEVTRKRGPRLLFNNEEERFSGQKHTNSYPQQSIDAMLASMRGMGLAPRDIDAWLSLWDYPALFATLARSVLEEAPGSLRMISREGIPLINSRAIDQGTRAARRIGQQLGLSEPVALIGTAHHDNHAWFSFATSPFACSERPVMVAVLDGLGDMGAISLYLCEQGRMRRVSRRRNAFSNWRRARATPITTPTITWC